MSFDREKYRQTIVSMLNASKTYNREETLLEMLVNEAEARYKTENRTSAVYVATPRPHDNFSQTSSTHLGGYAPYIKEDMERVKNDPSLRNTPSDLENGTYCSACGHYHFGMC